MDAGQEPDWPRIDARHVSRLAKETRLRHFCGERASAIQYLRPDEAPMNANQLSKTAMNGVLQTLEERTSPRSWAAERSQRKLSPWVQHDAASTLILWRDR
jgi:hypothetical protein